MAGFAPFGLDLSRFDRIFREYLGNGTSTPTPLSLTFREFLEDVRDVGRDRRLRDVAARQPTLYRTAYLLAGDHVGAEDLLQNKINLFRGI